MRVDSSSGYAAVGLSADGQMIGSDAYAGFSSGSVKSYSLVSYSDEQVNVQAASCDRPQSDSAPVLCVWMDMVSDSPPPTQEETTDTLLSSSIEVSDGSMFFEFERGLDDGGVTIPSSGEMSIIHSRGSDEDDLGYHDGESTLRLL